MFELIELILKAALWVWVVAGLLAWLLFVPLLIKRGEDFSAWLFHFSIGLLLFCGLGGAFLLGIVEELRGKKAG